MGHDQSSGFRACWACPPAFLFLLPRWILIFSFNDLQPMGGFQSFVELADPSRQAGRRASNAKPVIFTSVLQPSSSPSAPALSKMLSMDRDVMGGPGQSTLPLDGKLPFGNPGWQQLCKALTYEEWQVRTSMFRPKALPTAATIQECGRVLRFPLQRRQSSFCF